VPGSIPRGRLLALARARIGRERMTLPLLSVLNGFLAGE
jgi:hypothetical protein